jgi:hypothetical protein
LAKGRVEAPTTYNCVLLPERETGNVNA